MHVMHMHIECYTYGSGSTAFTTHLMFSKHRLSNRLTLKDEYDNVSQSLEQVW